MEGENEKETLFFFRYGMNLSAEIRYKSPVQPKRPGKPVYFPERNCLVSVPA